MEQVLTIIILAALVAAVVYSFGIRIRNKKKGIGGCGAACNGSCGNVNCQYFRNGENKG